ncbi:MAG: hypothetical protein Q8T08_02615, partial [Ignavibacteria bacterium]|nr:hypothetical protein [Ignavibacteria bacterium]
RHDDYGIRFGQRVGDNKKRLESGWQHQTARNCNDKNRCNYKNVTITHLLKIYRSKHLSTTHYYKYLYEVDRLLERAISLKNP